MADEFAHLTQADQHIAGAKERIARQRQLIERLAATGHSVRDAEGFLFALAGVLSAFESHRLLILKQLQQELELVVPNPPPAPPKQPRFL